MSEPDEAEALAIIRRALHDVFGPMQEDAFRRSHDSGPPVTSVWRGLRLLVESLVELPATSIAFAPAIAYRYADADGLIRPSISLEGNVLYWRCREPLFWMVIATSDSGRGEAIYGSTGNGNLEAVAMLEGDVVVPSWATAIDTLISSHPFSLEDLKSAKPQPYRVHIAMKRVNGSIGS